MADYLGYPFDPEIFNHNWQNEKDPVKTALLDSGAMVSDANIATMIAGGSDTYTIPFYSVIDGDPTNYDGQTDIASSEAGAKSQSGIVYGRGKGFTARDFIKDFNSGADPMRQITSQIARYWAKKRQATLLNILSAIFGLTTTGWKDHSLRLAADSGTASDANKISETSINDVTVKAVGDNSGIFTLAVMHSAVAQRLANLQLLQYRKYTDPQGIERQLNIADINGKTVLVDDGVPVTTNATTSANEYTTYILGAGSILTAKAPVDVPSETYRDPAKNGGQDTLYTRIRETIHPNGFTFSKPSSGYTASPTDAQLGNKANWSLVGNHKNVAIAQLITNG